tara:strand:- start:746 stop:1114 length:369 start_codon:yes stop_codon:yes gene_type:complete
MAAPNIVNVSSIYGKTNGVALTTTTTTDIISCASDKLIKVNSIIVANIDGTNAADATVYFYDHNLSHRTALADGVSVPAKSTLIVLGKDAPIYLEENDQIEAGASAAGDLHLTISYEILDDA